MRQEVGAYADPPGDRNRAVEVVACAFRRPGENGGRGCGTRQERFGSRRSRAKYRVVFGLRETYVEYETKEDSSTSCSIIEQGRFFYIAFLVSNKVSMKRRKQSTYQPAVQQTVPS